MSLGVIVLAIILSLGATSTAAGQPSHIVDKGTCKMTITQAKTLSKRRYPHATFIKFPGTQGARLVWFFENYVVPKVPGRGRLVIRANAVYIGEGPARHDIVLFGEKGCMTFALRVRKSDVHQIVRDAIGDAI